MADQSPKGILEDELHRWGKWAYCNVDKMLGAKPPGWVHDMKRGYERDNREAAQNRIIPMGEDKAPGFDKMVCSLHMIDRGYAEVIILKYCFHASLAKLDKVRRKPGNWHARQREAAFNVLLGIRFNEGYVA